MGSDTEIITRIVNGEEVGYVSLTLMLTALRQIERDPASIHDTIDFLMGVVRDVEIEAAR